MQLRIFTLKLHPLNQSFSDESVRAFLSDKRVLTIQDHFFMVNGEPFITLIITYEQGEISLPQKGNQPSKDSDWKEELSEESMPLFNQLREWRKERCKNDGVPPYVICTNKQLAQMAIQRPQTKEKLSELDGFGPAKMEKYSVEILSITRIQKESNES